MSHEAVADPESIVGLLAEPERLRVFAALVIGSSGGQDAAAGRAVDHARLRELTGLEQRAISRALVKLGAGGLVESGDGGYRPVTDAFTRAAMASAPPAERHGYADDQIEAVVRAFVKAGRVVAMPAQHSRRRVLLEHVVQSFEPGRDYTEKEVNAVLRAWTADSEVDHVTLRRYLVDEHLLARSAGSYRRSGGWVDVLE